jgi:molybdate transport system ATP-binding protein
MLRVEVVKTLGATTVEAAFASEGGVTALFGRSGAGKTSLINMIAGLLRPDRGRIELDGEVLDDTDKRIHVPPHRRRIGYVFQDARLFPHLNVRQNLDYGRRMNRLAEDPTQHKRITDLLDIGNLLDRRPGQLSGGERQRVALARALAVAPHALLLDEPFAALDVETRDEVRGLVGRTLRALDRPFVVVTHDLADAAALTAPVAVMEEGRIVQRGELAELTRAPATPYVARLTGSRA